MCDNKCKGCSGSCETDIQNARQTTWEKVQAEFKLEPTDHAEEPTEVADDTTRYWRFEVAIARDAMNLDHVVQRRWKWDSPTLVYSGATDRCVGAAVLFTSKIFPDHLYAEVVVEYSIPERLMADNHQKVYLRPIFDGPEWINSLIFTTFDPRLGGESV